jgi:hypothetical protein
MSIIGVGQQEAPQRKFVSKGPDNEFESEDGRR